MNSAGRDHFRQLIVASAEHGRVVVGSLAGFHPALVANYASAVVGPDQDHTFGQRHITTLVQLHTFHPEIADAIGFRLCRANHLDLLCNGAADQLAAGLGRSDRGVIRPKRPVMFPPVPDSPDHLTILQGIDALLPHLFQDLRMRVIGVRNLLRPAKRVQPHHVDMVLAVDQSTFGSEDLVLLVGKREGPRDNRVAAQTQQRFIDTVRHRQRDDILAPRIVGKTGEQVFVVDEPPAVLECGRPPCLVVVDSNLDVALVLRFLVDPIVPRIHAQQLFA